MPPARPHSRARARALQVEARPKALPLKPLALNKALAVRGGGATELWDAYNTALEETPLIAKCSTSLTGFAIADGMTQTLIEKIPFDLKRLVVSE